MVVFYLLFAIFLQESCCGIDGYMDWRNYSTEWSYETLNTSILVPVSCCVAEARNVESCNYEQNLKINDEVRVVMVV